MKGVNKAIYISINATAVKLIKRPIASKVITGRFRCERKFWYNCLIKNFTLTCFIKHVIINLYSILYFFSNLVSLVSRKIPSPCSRSTSGAYLLLFRVFRSPHACSHATLCLLLLGLGQSPFENWVTSLSKILSRFS